LFVTCRSCITEFLDCSCTRSCGYQLVYKQLPSSVTRLSSANILVNNQQDVTMMCNGGTYVEHINRSEIQYVVTVGCYCSLHVGPYFFLNEGLYCENGTLQNETIGVNIWFLLNVPYLSSIFSDHYMFHLDASYLFNRSVPVQLPKLAVNSKTVDELLIGDGSLQFSLEAAINQSLRSQSVYSSLSDYIFDQIVKMKGIGDNAVNWLSWRDWLLFIAVVVLVVNVFWTLLLHFRIRALYIMLPAVPTALPRVSAVLPTPPPQFIFYLPTAPVKNQTAHTSYTEILRIFQFYAPIELILVAAMVIAVMIWLGLFVFRRVKCENYRTFLFVEIGNNKTSVLVSVAKLRHPPNFYQFNVFCDKILLQLRHYFLFGEFAYTGVFISHTLLGQRVSLENVVRFGVSSCTS